MTLVCSPEKQRIARKFSHAAETYDKATRIQFAAGEALLQQMATILADQRTQPLTVLDIGCGTGRMLSPMLTTLPTSNVIGIDMSQSMLNRAQMRIQDERLHFCCADFEAMPFYLGEQSLLLFSNFALQWALSKHVLFNRLSTINTKECFLAFTIPGPKTFQELAQAWHQADGQRHVNRFEDIGYWCHHVQQAGFEVLFQDQTSQIDYFDSVKSALVSIRQGGVTHALGQRRSALLGKTLYRRFLEAYDAQKHHVEGAVRVPLTYEVFTVIARRL